MRVSGRSVLLASLFVLACGEGDPPDVELPTLRAPATPAPTQTGGTRLRVRVGAAEYADDGRRFRAESVDLELDAATGTLRTLSATDVRASGTDADGWSAVVPRLTLDDLVLGDGRTSARLPPTRVRLALDGRALPPLMLSGTLAMDDAGYRGRLVARTSSSAVTATALGLDRWHVDAAPLDLAELRGLVDGLPGRGTLRGEAVLARVGEDWLVRTDGLTLETGASLLHLAGAARTGPTASFEDLRARLDPLAAQDLQSMFDIDLPLGIDRLRGTLRLDGGGAGGAALVARLTALDSLDRPARLAADGRVWLDPVRLAVDVTADSLRLAPDYPVVLYARVEGAADDLTIDGAVDPLLDPRSVDPEARLDPRIHQLIDAARARFSLRLRGGAVSGSVALVEQAGESPRLMPGGLLAGADERVWLTAEGGLSADDRITIDAAADSLPLALLPWPAQLEGVTGQARARLRITGSTEAPRLAGELSATGFSLAWPEWGVMVEDASLDAELDGSRIDVDLNARRGAGRIIAVGGVDLARPLDPLHVGRSLEGANVDLVATVDRFEAVDIDSARAVIDGRISVSGPLRRPHVAGDLALVDGFVFEGRLAPDPPLDPDDPPLVELAARAPWLEDGRLRAAARAGAADDAERAAEDANPAGPDDEPGRTPPLTADVAVRLTPAFRVVDEDSDLGTDGVIRVTLGEQGLDAEGVAEIRDGFYAYYGHRFDLDGGALAIRDAEPRLAMIGSLRTADRPLASGVGGLTGIDQRMPPTTILGYSTPATVYELLRRETPLPATQAQLGSWLLFGTPVTPSEAWSEDIFWRSDEPEDFVGHRSGVQGSGLLWAYLADELYDWVPLENGYFRAGTVVTGSPYPGPLMVGSLLQATAVLDRRWELSASHIVGAGAAPGVAIRYVLRSGRLDPPARHIEIFAEPRVLPTARTRADGFDTRSRWGLRLRWVREY